MKAFSRCIITNDKLGVGDDVEQMKNIILYIYISELGPIPVWNWICLPIPIPIPELELELNWLFPV